MNNSIRQRDGVKTGYVGALTAMVAVLLLTANCRQTAMSDGVVTGHWPSLSASTDGAFMYQATPATKRRIEPRPDDPPPRTDDCQGNFEACMESRLSRKRGGRWGHSVCQDCRDRCKAEGKWPDKTYDDKDCQWWNYPPKKKKKTKKR